MEANLNPSSIHLSTYSIHDNNIKKVNVQIVQYNIVCIDASEINFYLFYSVTCCADSWILFLAVVKLVGSCHVWQHVTATILHQWQWKLENFEGDEKNGVMGTSPSKTLILVHLFTASGQFCYFSWFFSIMFSLRILGGRCPPHPKFVELCNWAFDHGLDLIIHLVRGLPGFLFPCTRCQSVLHNMEEFKDIPPLLFDFPP